MSRVRCLRWGIVALLVGLPSSAHAYCRKMSKSNVPASYDPSTAAEGCESNGVPLFWPDPCIDYEVIVEPGWSAAGRMTLDEARSWVAAEFLTWAKAACVGRFEGKYSPNLELRDRGTGPGCPGSPARNEVRFSDDAVEQSSGTLAVTAVQKKEASGTITQASVAIYATAFTSAQQGVDPKGQLRAVVRHELGHFLGLAHSNTKQSVMYFASQDTREMPGLMQDDIDGICDMYSSLHPVGGGCAVAVDGGGDDGGHTASLFPMAVLLSGVVMALGRRTTLQGQRLFRPRD